MNESIYTDPTRRHDFVLFFEVQDGNPNGDPDAGNMPRIDPETMAGLVSDVCLKRKVRNYVSLTQTNRDGYAIYVNDGGIALNTLHEQAYKDEGIKSTGTKQKRDDIDKVRARMCAKFFDVRLFGAVMTTGVNCGQVRGPVQFTFARSISPIVPMDISITRVAITKPEDAELVVVETDGDDKGKTKGKVTEMGRKSLVPYGLYMARGFFSAPFAGKTGVSANDLELFWQALQMMWDLDHSAARGLMDCRGLYIFSHANAIGNAPAQILFDRISVKLNDGIDAPRAYNNYTIAVNDSNLPEGVTFTPLVDGRN
jgi:CRISPR-associated protein Csd2